MLLSFSAGDMHDGPPTGCLLQASAGPEQHNVAVMMQVLDERQMLSVNCDMLLSL